VIGEIANSPEAKIMIKTNENGAANLLFEMEESKATVTDLNSNSPYVKRMLFLNRIIEIIIKGRDSFYTLTHVKP
jgi:hypothetical protein